MFLDLELAGFGVEFDLGRSSQSSARRHADTRQVVLGHADQTGAGDHRHRPLVTGLMSAGTSLPVYLPPSSIAFFAACA